MAIGVDKIHITNLDDVKFIQRHMVQYMNFVNLFKIIFNHEIKLAQASQELDELKKYKVTNLLQDISVVRAVFCNQTGGQKAEDVAFLKEYFLSKNDPYFLAFQELYQTYGNEKNIYYALKIVISNIKNQFKAKTYNFPKAKKISKINHFAFTLDASKYVIHRENKKLEIKLGKTTDHRRIYVNYKNLQEHTLDNLTSIQLCYIHGHIELRFNYQTDEVKRKFKKVKTKDKVVAGMDLGLNNTFTLTVHDKDTPSIAFDGHELIKYSCDFNYNIVKARELIRTKCIVNHKNRKKDEKIIYNSNHKHFNKILHDHFYWRDHYYDDVFQKMSVRVLEYCVLNKVTHLVVSKNLLEVKNKGKLTFGKTTSQKFYQIPFGKLIKHLEEKCKRYGIVIEPIDEAYTSKTSPLVDMQEILERAKILKEENEKNQTSKKIPSIVYGGRREGRYYYLNGKGKKCKGIYDADCVGAYNHVRVKYGTGVPVHEMEVYKLKKPIVIKSTEAFMELIRDCGSGRESWILDLKNRNVL